MNTRSALRRISSVACCALVLVSLTLSSLLILSAPAPTGAAPARQAVTIVPATIVPAPSTTYNPPPPPYPGGGGYPTPPYAYGTPTAPPTATATATPVPCEDAFDANGPDTAKPIVLAEPQTRIICPAEEIEWAVFHAGAGKTYAITTGPGSIPQLDTEMWVVDRQDDGSDAELAYNDDSPQAQPGFSRIEFQAPQDRWYFIKVANRDGIGYPGLAFVLRLDLLNQSAVRTATRTPGIPADNTATAVRPSATSTINPAATAAAEATIASRPTLPTPSSTLDPLLYPVPGNPNTENLPVFLAGDPQALAPDRFDEDAGNDTLETAMPLATNALYEYLNFVARPSQPWDSDFYAFQAKGSTCYRVFTTHVGTGLDTTLVLWAATITHTNGTLQIYADPTRTPLAQNDDAAPGTGDTHSLVRWCSTRDQATVIEAHTHYWEPLVNTIGKTYALGLAVEPPTPTPTPSVTPSPSATRAPLPPAPVLPGPGSGGGSNPPAGGNPPGASSAPTPRSTEPVILHELPGSTLPSSPQPQGTGSTPLPPSMTPVATRTIAPTTTPSATASATPAPPQVSVDVVVYFAATRGQSTKGGGPDPNTAIPNLRLQLVNLRTNQVFAETVSDDNGHARFTWGWTGSVQVAIPQFQQAYLIEARDLGINATGGLANANSGQLYLPIQIQPYAPPAVHP